MSDTTAGKIRDFITGRFPTVRFTDEEDIFSLGFVNSLFAMELVMHIEKTFGATIPNDELQIDNFRSVTSMTGLVGRLSPAGVS
ncbi:acyl carrier protein [Amycolatopsis sp. GM8]|uniref:acyl carrier protein n=1 Tax=Amycolatopsis sp. GM8 TaxID=2896530 RepID=UPI001F28B9E5|nr:acyl carrier protein [Amycolatopsis sp. GM8]